VERWDDDRLLQETPRTPSAFGVFYRRHERAVLGYLVRRTGDAEVAADLAAETFAAALLGVRRYRPGERPAAAWLFGIARHRLLRALERGRVDDQARRRLGMEPLRLDDDLLERIERAGADMRAEALLEQLTPDQSRAIRARVIDERPYREIASALRCSESVVRQRVSRGLAALRALSTEDGT
jgi:RNA polymerase sigma-70 factor (ECF subfamily)